MQVLFQGEVGSQGPTGSPGKEGLIGAKVKHLRSEIILNNRVGLL